MYENAIKNVSKVLKDSQSFARYFRCIYDSKEEENFIDAWEDMLGKHSLQQNELLKWMFRKREKWAVVYWRKTFFVDEKGSHPGENLFNNMRNYLISGFDVLKFFKHFENVVDEQRYKEIEASDEMSRCMPRLMGKAVLLRHSSEFYTPRAFEVFQRGYEKCLNVVVNLCSENGSLFEYKANKFGQTRDYNVTFNSLDDKFICSCKKFEYVGFLCSHALKVLDQRNIKVVPSRYILKRWTKDARLGSVKGCNGLTFQDNPKMVIVRRYKDLCHRILTLSARACESEEAFQFASRQLDEVREGVEKILILKPEEAQAVTSSSNGANSSEGEHAEFFLDGKAIEDQDDNRAKHGERAILNGGQQTNLNDEGSTAKGIYSVEAFAQSAVTCISSSPPVYVSPQATNPGNAIMQWLYNFEANQVDKCMYQQSNLVMDQQTISKMYKSPNIFTNQHDSPSQSQLLQEPLIHGTYSESVSNTVQLRQEMDLDI